MEILKNKAFETHNDICSIYDQVRMFALITVGHFDHQITDITRKKNSRSK